MDRVDSQLSTSSKTSVKWEDQMLSPTFHNVQVEQVKIIHRNPERVSFQENPPLKPHSAGDSSIIGLRMFAPPPSEEGSMGTNNSEERHAFRENYLHCIKRRRTPQIVEGSYPFEQGIEPNRKSRFWTIEQLENIPLVTLPLEPVGTVLSKETPQNLKKISNSAGMKNQRQKLAVMRHMQRLQSVESPQQIRLMSANKNDMKNKISNEYPQTASEARSGFFEADICPDVSIDRAKTAPHISKSIIWTAKNRINSSRAVSSVLSYKTQLNELDDMQSNAKPNVFIKLPFKQAPCITMNVERNESEDIVRPDFELRLMTAFTVSRVRKALKQLPHIENMNDRISGKLVKAKLKPLQPVNVPGPGISACRGIQPEYRRKKQAEGYIPSPSRQQQLKHQLNQIYEEHRLKQAEYERRMIRAQSATSGESVHPTSPVPSGTDSPYHAYVLNDQTGLNMDDALAVSNQMDSLHLESSVIF